LGGCEPLSTTPAAHVAVPFGSCILFEGWPHVGADSNRSRGASASAPSASSSAIGVSAAGRRSARRIHHIQLYRCEYIPLFFPIKNSAFALYFKDMSGTWYFSIWYFISP
jgi:hypothetical protein